MNRLADEKSVQRRADGPEIGASVDGFHFSECLLFGHEARRTEEHAGPCSECARTRRLEARDTEVENAKAACFVEKQIVGFEIAVNDAKRVGRLEDVTEVHGDVESHGFRQATAETSCPRSDALAPQELEHEEYRALVDVVVEHAYDARMFDGVCDVTFTKEAGFDVGVGAELWREYFNRDAQTIAMRGFVHGRHAALPQQSLKRVLST